MSKAIKLIVFLLILANEEIVFSQTAILFSEKGLKAALEQGNVENKPVMLWCYASWCPHCKQMKTAVFSNQAVADYFNNTYTCVAQDMEKGDGIKLKDSLKIMSYPTFIFYNPGGEIVYRVEGELKPAEFITEGKNALIRKKQLPFLKQQFEENVSNSTNCFDYVRALKKGGMDVSTVVNKYFATQNDSQLLSEVNWRIFTNGVSDFNSREFKFVIGHQKEFANITSPERVKRKLDYEVKSLLNPIVEATDTIQYPIKRKLAAEIHSYSTDSLIFNFDLKMYELTHNWKMYGEISLQSVEAFAWNNHTQLSDIAGNFLKNITNPNALLQAERWAQRSLTLDEEYDTYLLCSKLYHKVKDIPNAIKMAKKATVLSTKFGWEGTDADELLKELNIAKK